jgi:hypothetical protein
MVFTIAMANMTVIAFLVTIPSLLMVAVLFGLCLDWYQGGDPKSCTEDNG